MGGQVDALIERKRPFLVLCATLNPSGFSNDNWEMGILRRSDECLGALTSSEPGWAKASNRLLEQAASLGADALFIDDDVVLLEGGLDRLFIRRHTAGVVAPMLFNINSDCTRLVLQMPASDVNVSNGSIEMSSPSIVNGFFLDCEVPTVSTSCVYIRKEAIDAGVRFPEDWPGEYHEDVKFCLDAWMHGFSVVCVPGGAIHKGSATKRNMKDLDALFEANRKRLVEWCVESGCADWIEGGKIPTTMRPAVDQ